MGGRGTSTASSISCPSSSRSWHPPPPPHPPPWPHPLLLAGPRRLHMRLKFREENRARMKWILYLQIMRVDSGGPAGAVGVETVGIDGAVEEGGDEVGVPYGVHLREGGEGGRNECPLCVHLLGE